ncbi:MAG: hypothetical protein JSS79_19590 [Bacteroidetes bacterium]|nr:hypothetical protein [Bacteroidota bacterium]
MLVTAALISFGTWIATKLADKGFDHLFDSAAATPDTLNKRFYDAVDRTSIRMQTKYPRAIATYADYFFKHEVVFGELVKLLFHDSKINTQIARTRFEHSALPDTFIVDFISCLKRELLLDEKIGPILQNNQAYIVLQGINTNLELIAQNSNLSLLELQKILKAIEERLTREFSYDDFKVKYKQSALNVLSQVNFIGLGVDISIKRKRKNLQDIFVKPLFSVHKKKDNSTENTNDGFDEFEDEDIPYSNLLSNGVNPVVLGNPGSGKSVLIKSLICDILNEKISEFEDRSITNYLPFRIELRKYLAFKKKNQCNIIRYIVNTLEVEYGILNITDSILNEIFSNYKVLVFFDGLDEVFKINDKIEIKNDIENFHVVYPMARSLTSSRIIGYDEASLDENKFTELRIQNFNTEQIEEYVRKWYNKEEADTEIRTKEVEKFLELKEEIDEELIRNPLLLSLIVIIYRNILKIPESKLEIYQSCTKTLVDKWDAEKDLQIDLNPNIYKEKEKIFSDLAYWQYEQLSGENIQLSYEKAKNTVCKTIKNKLSITDDNDAEELAESFMTYAQKRSIYFDNNFTHKTFLEYYTAYWIYSNIEKKHKPAERDQIIGTYISNPFWFIVLELLFNMIDKDQPDSEIIDGIIDSQIKSNLSSLLFLLSVLPTLKNVSTEQASKVFYNSIKYLFDLNPQRNTSPSQDGPSNIYFQLEKNYADNSTFRTLIKNQLMKIETEGTYDRLIYTFHFELMFGGRRADEPIRFYLNDNTKFKSILREDQFLFQLNKFSDELNWHESYLEFLVEFIEVFGVEDIFKEFHSTFGGLLVKPLIETYLGQQLLEKNIEKAAENLEELSKIGLAKNRLLSYLMNKKRFNFLNPERLEQLAICYNNASDEYVSLIVLCVMLKNATRYKNSIPKLIELCTNKDKQESLIRLTREKNFDKALQQAIDKYLTAGD